MKSLANYVIGAALLFGSAAALACDYPAKADIPNGTTASKEEMLAAQKSIKTFMAEMETYLACLDEEEAAAVAQLGDIGDEEKANREAAATKKYNAAVEEMNLIAARYNEEVRAYKEQSN